MLYSLKQPALGLLWSSCIHTRIALTRTGESSGVTIARNPQYGGGSSRGADVTHRQCNGVERSLTVVFSADVPPNSCYFRVANDGVHGVVVHRETGNS